MASDSEIEVLGFNQDILDSLFEETHGDEQDDEPLNTVIRSLEAETNPDLVVEYHNLLGQVEHMGKSGINSSTNDAGIDVDLSWVDLETVASSPNDDMNWYMNQYGEKMQEVAEFGMMGEYSQFYYNGFSLEDRSYCPLWQETCDDEIMH